MFSVAKQVDRDKSLRVVRTNRTQDNKEFAILLLSKLKSVLKLRKLITSIEIVVGLIYIE